mmetsp:Transcript_17540/g.38334  ORF Transcript_17540/g.38334 Transcript_17540/m.38334 type:complete len:489 (+) Transcript_17540:37-1503(+)
MAPKSLDFSHEFSDNGYVPEHKDQRIVKTPYGRGAVIRTRKGIDHDVVDKEQILIKEIELLDWTQSKLDDRKSAPSMNSSKLQMLYSPTKFPSVSPVVGSEVLTLWGRGKVKEIRDDHMKTHVVKLSSWRLDRRSSVICYVSGKDCEVMRPKKIYDMDVFEKVEEANDLKQQATAKFKKKDYTGALALFARAVDAVRYIQHKPDSTNEVRADLIVMMITCSNNAALCSSKKKDWERVAKFGANAMVLIEALQEKGDESKIKKVINRDGIGDSQLFGTWKVKSLLLIAKAQMELHGSSNMNIRSAMKRALEAISVYKNEGDPMYKQLSTQEKDLRRFRLEFSKKTKAAKTKEKERARAMFGGEIKENKNSEKKESTIQHSIPISNSGSTPSSPCPLDLTSQHLSEQRDNSNDVTMTTLLENISAKSKVEELGSSKNQTACIDILERVDDNEDEDDDCPQPFIEEHGEALLILSGIALGWIVVKLVTTKR